MIKYALHPGYITSKNDGNVHYIGVVQLARLYKLNPNEWIVWDHGYKRDDFIHLYPNYNGNYGRPE